MTFVQEITVKHRTVRVSILASTVALFAGALAAQQAPAPTSVPQIPFESQSDFLKYPASMNLGETLGVAVNSKGTIVVLNHPGSATSGPLYGNATSQLFEFDRNGRFVRELGQGVYGLGYAHSVRFDRYDNLWVVDKGTHSVMRFNPAGYVTMNLGRRPEGPDDPEELYFRGNGLNPAHPGPAAAHADGLFNGPTDIAWDSDDNMYISDGYINSRVAKIDKNGDWVKSWGTRGTGGTHADENPGQFNTPHNIAVDRQNRVYVADRGNRRIQVFDAEGNFLRFIHQNAPYDKQKRPVLGNRPANAPDETAPWVLCITDTPTQYLYSIDSVPGRIYKMTLDGKILGTIGESGRGPGQFNWAHGLSCSAENVLYVADMNNWRVLKLTLHPEKATTAAR